MSSAYEPLILPTASFPQLQSGTAHSICTREGAHGYPERALHGPVEWSRPDSGYQPVDYTSQKVLEGPVWADPAEPAAARRMRPEGEFLSYEGVRTSEDGVTPRNPRGRTGLRGRGLLGKWGANFAADPIVTRVGPESGKLELIAIQRRDSGNWALPGGMVDEGEGLSLTLARELAEEALGKGGEGVDELEREFARRFEENGREVYAGYVDDPRNTDNAWMETRAVHLHLKGSAAEFALVAGDDAGEVQWMVLDAPHLEQLYSIHAAIMGQALQMWQATAELRVLRDGSVVTPSA